MNSMRDDQGFKSLFFSLACICLFAVHGWLLVQGCTYITAPIPEYPQVLTFSPERYNNFISTWRKFTEKYGISYYVPEVDSVLMVPGWFAIPGVNLLPQQNDSLTLDEAKNLVLQFADEWKSLFNVSASELRLTAAYFHNVIRQYYFNFEKDFSYGVAVSTGFNQVVATLTSRGALTQFSTNCAPTLPVPVAPAVDSTKAKSNIAGKQLTYYDWTGEKRLTISRENTYEAKLVAAIIPRPDVILKKSLEYRLCWKIRVPVFYVFVDAITGEDIGFIQQYVIF